MLAPREVRPLAKTAITKQRIPTDSELSPQQDTVIDALLGGSNVTAAAKRARVHRCTVHDWLRNDLAFQCSLNERRAELRSAMRIRLTNLAEKAIDVVSDAIENGGDARCAMELLKGMELIAPPKIGITDRHLLLHMARQREIAKDWQDLADEAGQFVTPVRLGEELDY